MKKYIQITIVLGFFSLLVFFRQAKGDQQPIVGIPTPTNANIPTTTNVQPTRVITPTTGSSSGKYKDGTYTGSVEDASYGNLQVQAVITNGKLSDVVFLQYPNDNGTSTSINTQALPILKSEAIQAQSAQVDIVSGASDSSPAFTRSLAQALQQASN